MKFKVEPSVETLVNTSHGVAELEFTVGMHVGNGDHKVRVTVKQDKKLDATRLGKDIIEYVFELGDLYGEMIRMCNAWCKEFVAKEGGPGNSPLDNDSQIDATKEFSLRQIYITQEESNGFTYFGNNKYKYDTVIWFTNWNDSGRGFEARFYKGKLVNVEMAP